MTLPYRNHIETFKITHEYDRWHLHFHDRTVKTCDNLANLAKNIKTSSKQTFRLAPSEYGKFNGFIENDLLIFCLRCCLHLTFNTDKSTSLLLCMPPHQITAKQTINEHSENELRKKRAQLFDPIKDLRKYQSKYQYI